MGHGEDHSVPNGTGGVPAFFDLKTGKLEAFSHLANRVPGSWFVAGDPNGQLHVDPDYNRELHEDRYYETKWSHRNPWVSSQKLEPWAGREWLFRAGSRNRISAGGTTYRFATGLPGVQGKVCSMLAADNKMFVVTDEGWLYCLGARAIPPKTYQMGQQTLQAKSDAWSREVTQILRATGKSTGYALVWGIGTGRLIEELAIQTRMHIIAVDPDVRKVDLLRRRFDAAGLYGKRIVIHCGTPTDFEFPAYLADLIVSEDLQAAGVSQGIPYVKRMFDSLRPYGAAACLSIPDRQTSQFAAGVRQANLVNAEVKPVAQFTVLSRQGALPGAANYLGQWRSPDALVKAPLGVLWFDDTIKQFKRSPQPKIIDGVMISQPKAWLTTVRPYALDEQTFADVYTGRVLSREEAMAAVKTMPEGDHTAQPAHYKPPEIHKDNVWGQRVNPVTGLTEPRVLPKSYGCEPGVDYGHMVTMRSGTGAFYDKRFESGLINVSGIRTGCTNSIIPANGILNVPYFYEGCTCGYPLASGLGMVHMPETYEQWMAWGDTEFKGRIKRLGINFGAPGDRMTNSGTLWLDYPSVGGPSPKVSLDVTPQESATYYHHSLWIEGGSGMPWVTASGLTGAEKISVELVPAGYQGADANDVLPYTVRLHFAEPDPVKRGARVFSISLQGQDVLRDFDIAKTTGGPMRGVVKEFTGIKIGKTLDVQITARSGRSILSGIELILDQ